MRSLIAPWIIVPTPRPPYPAIEGALQKLYRREHQREHARWKHIRDPRIDQRPGLRLIAVVQHKVAHGTAGSTTQAVTVTATGAGNLLIAWVSGGDSTVTPTGVSDGTNSFTKFTGAAFSNPSGPSWESDLYYLLSSTSGKTTITGTWNGTGGGKTILVWEVSGFTSPVTDGASAQATQQTGVLTTDTGPALTTTGSTGFVVAGTLVTNSIIANPKVGNAFTDGGDIASSGDAGCSLISSGASTYTPEWTDASSGDAFQAFTAAFKESGGGGGGDLSVLTGEPITGSSQIEGGLR
jgi:hypothetical protein